ncbi:hypothetical protein DEO72_LG9g1146 [Vigna unguiculata]|uniref:Uncharacterized protein n=1 Tax=Vigna unguiculata TaxID=3917 RepID=A0A4D6N239_VIGUN|nr:hypothetical protein DEO72_LG9g1146 [Vigna unguiculata]
MRPRGGSRVAEVRWCSLHLRVDGEGDCGGCLMVVRERRCWMREDGTVVVLRRRAAEVGCGCHGWNKLHARGEDYVKVLPWWFSSVFQRGQVRKMVAQGARWSDVEMAAAAAMVMEGKLGLGFHV